MGSQSANLRLACRSYAGPAHFYCTLKRLPLGARPTELWLVSIGMVATVNILDPISTAAISSATSIT